MPKKVEISRESLEKYVGSGMTQKELAIKYDCSVLTIKTRMKEFGIKPSQGLAQTQSTKLQASTTALDIDAIVNNLPIIAQDAVAKDLNDIRNEISNLANSGGVQTCLKVNTLVDGIIYVLDGQKLMLCNLYGGINIEAGVVSSVKTGLSVDMPPDCIGLIQSPPNSNRTLSVFATCIHSGEEIEVTLSNNHVIDNCYVDKGEVVAQLVILRSCDVCFVE